MTDLIDLATLASLGQHFSSHEDVAELKVALAGVQNDLALIKGFLLQQFGSEFSNAFEHEETQQLAAKKPSLTLQKMKTENRQVNGLSSSKAFSNETHSGQLQRPRPPPLQRFSRVISSDEGTSLVGKNVTKASTNSTEKFHRNFLSMSSLKGNQNRFRSTTVGNDSLKRSSSILHSAGSGSIKVEPEDYSRSSSRVVYKMPRLTNAALPSGGAHTNGIKNEEEYNESEEAYTAVADAEENYEETGEEEDLGYAAYDESCDYQEEGEYDDSTNEITYQEDDGTIYEEDYSMEGLNESGSAIIMPNQNLSVQLISNRRSTNAVYKTTPQRRLSLPTASNESLLADAGMASGSGAGDPNFLKKCKVCHEEVPSYSLFNHVVNSHYKGEVPTCTICKKTFTYKQGLISHMRYHDAEKYDKACSFCGKKFIRRSDVIIHERRLHTGERPFTCPVPDCNQGFVRRYCLLTHVKTNHGEPYMSQIVRSSNRKD